MKKLLSFSLALILTGCSAHYIPYKVTSDMPHSLTVTSSKAVFIDGFGASAITINLKFISLGYGVLAVHDSGTKGDRYYIMFAPGNVIPTRIDDVNFEYTAALLPEEIPAALAMLDKAIKEWEVEEVKNDGTFYSFVTHREAYVPETSLSNITSLAWVPALGLKYNRTSKGSALTTFIGDENYQFQFTSHYIGDAKALYSDIQKAESELKRMGMR